jgi:hypothetical protein
MVIRANCQVRHDHLRPFVWVDEPVWGKLGHRRPGPRMSLVCQSKLLDGWKSGNEAPARELTFAAEGHGRR